MQQDDEPMATYYARIREIARKCSSTDKNDRCHDTRPLNQNNAKQRDSCYCHCNGSVDKTLYRFISQVHKFIHGRTGQYFLGGAVGNLPDCQENCPTSFFDFVTDSRMT